jgi:hypothetical protein
MPRFFTTIFRFAVLIAFAQLAHAAEPTTSLAIKGYDPVAYFTLGKAVPGRPELEYEWDEQRYRFARPEHLALFKADPAHYAPRFGNLCTIALAEGKIVAANPEYWVISQGRLYLFGKAIGPKLFQQNVAGTLAQAEHNRPH